MSDLTKHWAWKQRLAPNLKLLLLVLSDESDDRGECGTSPVSHFAHKCCMGERTVFRLLGQLEGYGLISRSKRFQDGRQVASEYRLNLDTHHRGEIPADQVEQARTASLAGPRGPARRTRSSRPASSAVRPVGTRTAELADQTTKAVVVSSTTKRGDSSDTLCTTDLIPPLSYTPQQQASALVLVAHLPGPLDSWSWTRLKATNGKGCGRVTTHCACSKASFDRRRRKAPSTASTASRSLVSGSDAPVMQRKLRSERRHVPA